MKRIPSPAVAGEFGASLAISELLIRTDGKRRAEIEFPPVWSMNDVLPRLLHDAAASGGVPDFGSSENEHHAIAYSANVDASVPDCELVSAARVVG